VSGASSVLANDSDVEGNALSAVLVTGPAHGTLTLNANGTFSYTHDGSETTSDSFTYRANDGTVNGNIVTVNIGVTPMNDAPLSSNQSLTTPEDTPLNGSILATDSDGGALTYAVTGNATNGSVSLDPSTGAFTYTPNANYNGSDSFVVTISDGNGGSTTSTINVGVTPLNDAPVAVADSISVLEGGTATVLVSGASSVLANDSDVEGNALSAVLVTGPAHGTLTLNANGTFSYTHDGSETTSDSFTYRANDGTVNGNIVTVNIGVTPVNDAPLSSNHTGRYTAQWQYPRYR
jgi:VCBS repeat-containing protein